MIDGTKNADKTKPSVTPEQINEFRLKDYDALRTEIMARLEELWKIEKFALGGAAAITALLLTHTKEVPAHSIGWWLPCVFLVICAERFVTDMFHLTFRSSRYLIRTEKYFLEKEGEFEVFFRKLPYNETIAYFLVWSAAIFASAALPFMGFP